MSNHKTVSIPEIKGYDYSMNLSNDKNIKRGIKEIEKIIRSSQEYKDYIKYLKENVDMTRCAFFKNVNSNVSKVKIEIHHEPLTLYDIVETVLNKHIDEDNGCVNAYDVAEEVMRLHYQDEVGLIPLSITLHKMVHNSDKIKIPLHLIYGNYIKFISDYEDYVDEKVVKKLEDKIKETKLLTEDSFDAIKVNFSYLDVDGFKLPEYISDDISDSKDESKVLVA